LSPINELNPKIILNKLQSKPLDTYKENKYIKFCISLAKLASSATFRNPNVGACLVYHDQIIGQGYHQEFGKAHAEVNAINSVKDQNKSLIEKATLYVTLEPCNHWGKTGPCTDYILKHNIKKLVFGNYDPNPKMQGKSIAFLKQNNVEIIGPILEKECRELIKPYITNLSQNRPYISLKWAQSSDFYIGKINERIKISNKISDIYVHKMRSEHDAILVGSNTFLIDKPKLNTRHYPGKNPKIIILDRRNRIAKEKLTLDNSTIVSSNSELGTLLSELLNDHNITRLMIEGGATIHRAFIEANLWDTAHIITNNGLTLESGIPSPLLQGKLKSKQSLGNDSLQIIGNNMLE
jgi:diaminohydroxyphosphoribosylaminopyrimidine deaminase/5-amino-6-(5-phosphoribosylamino)uracil reductase